MLDVFRDSGLNVGYERDFDLARVVMDLSSGRASSVATGDDKVDPSSLFRISRTERDGPRDLGASIRSG